MIKLFRFIKEMYQLKMNKLTLEVLLLNKLYELTKVFDGSSEVLELAKKLQGVDQKDIVNELVKAKAKSEA